MHLLCGIINFFPVISLLGPGRGVHRGEFCQRQRPLFMSPVSVWFCMLFTLYYDAPEQTHACNFILLNFQNWNHFVLLKTADPENSISPFSARNYQRRLLKSAYSLCRRLSRESNLNINSVNLQQRAIKTAKTSRGNVSACQVCISFTAALVNKSLDSFEKYLLLYFASIHNSRYFVKGL